MTPASALALCLVVAAPAGAAQDKKPQVWKGVIKDVRGAENLLTAVPLNDLKAKPKEFDLLGARFVDESDAEIKVGDLNAGDQIQITFEADGKKVQEVKIIKRAKPPA